VGGEDLSHGPTLDEGGQNRKNHASVASNKRLKSANQIKDENNPGGFGRGTNSPAKRDSRPSVPDTKSDKKKTTNQRQVRGVESSLREVNLRKWAGAQYAPGAVTMKG